MSTRAITPSVTMLVLGTLLASVSGCAAETSENTSDQAGALRMAAPAAAVDPKDKYTAEQWAKLVEELKRGGVSDENIAAMRKELIDTGLLPADAIAGVSARLRAVYDQMQTYGFLPERGIPTFLPSGSAAARGIASNGQCSGSRCLVTIGGFHLVYERGSSGDPQQLGSTRGWKLVAMEASTFNATSLLQMFDDRDYVFNLKLLETALKTAPLLVVPFVGWSAAVAITGGVFVTDVATGELHAASSVTDIAALLARKGVPAPMQVAAQLWLAAQLASFVYQTAQSDVLTKILGKEFRSVILPPESLVKERPGAMHQ